MMIDIWQPDPHKLDLTWIILKYQKIIQAAYSYITSYHIVSCINPTFIVDVYCSTLFICMRENFVRFISAIASSSSCIFLAENHSSYICLKVYVSRFIILSIINILLVKKWVNMSQFFGGKVFVNRSWPTV